MRGYIPVILVLAYLGWTTADYACICNYNQNADVYATVNGRVVDHMHEFDCHPLCQRMSHNNWVKISRVGKPEGFVQTSGNVLEQLCPGNPPTAPPTTPKPTTTTTTRPTTRPTTTTPKPTTTTTTTTPKPTTRFRGFGPVGYIGNTYQYRTHMDEPSGLGASRIHTNILYAHDDENDDAEVYAIDATNGRVLATFPVIGATNLDWEDLAVGPCGRNDHRSCIYIHDEGNDSDVNAHGDPVIYKIVEPAVIRNQNLPIESKLYYTWSGGSSNTLMVDPHSDIYILASNYHHRVKMAKLPSSAWGNSPHSPAKLHANYYFGVVPQRPGPDGADISPNGKEIIIINDGILYYYTTDDGNYLHTLSSSGQKLVTQLAGYGTDMAVSWSADGQSVYILDEKTDELFKLDKI